MERETNTPTKEHSNNNNSNTHQNASGVDNYTIFSNCDVLVVPFPFFFLTVVHASTRNATVAMIDLETIIGE